MNTNVAMPIFSRRRIQQMLDDLAGAVSPPHFIGRLNDKRFQNALARSRVGRTQSMAWEQRLAERDVEQMRRDWEYARSCLSELVALSEDCRTHLSTSAFKPVCVELE